MHGGDALARAGDVLASVPQFPSARPAQHQRVRARIKPLEPAPARYLGRARVRGGIRVTDSDMFQLVVLAQAVASRPVVPELPQSIHAGLPLPGVGTPTIPEQGRTFTNHRNPHKIKNHRYVMSLRYG
jgi:hypothetical protein